MEAAWWISHQVPEHVFATIAHGDRRNDDPLPRPLTEILRDVRSATSKGSRPFPRDRLLVAAEFTADSLEHLLDRHRHRTVRIHEQLPFHQIREVDTRSMAWLARQPGRNIREKLSGRTHALGVKRDLSVDTTENRLLRSFVIGGPGAFALEAESFEAFGRAIVQKLIKEIAAVPEAKRTA